MLDQARPLPSLKLSSRSVELLLDLVEIKLGAMEIDDRDERTIWQLKRCRDELKTIESSGRGAAPSGRSRQLYATA
jgi:hypothetical protein